MREDMEYIYFPENFIQHLIYLQKNQLQLYNSKIIFPGNVIARDLVYRYNVYVLCACARVCV